MTAVSAELPRHTVNVLDIDTTYVTAGNPAAQPVVLLHGMSSSADVYREIMHGLSDAFWLIAPDLPGFGTSAMTQPYTLAHLVEWLAALRDQLDLPPFHLIGHSFGGALATSFAASYPEDIVRLVLVAPAIVASAAFPDLVKQAAINLGLVDLSTAVSQSRAVVQQAVRAPFYDASRMDDSLWERRVLAYDQARASADVLKALAFQDLRPIAERITDPTLIVWGENDSVLPVNQADVVGALVPNGRVYRLPECGHVVMAEKRLEFQALVRAFLLDEDDGRVYAAIAARRARPVPVISVFGSSAPREGEPEYEQARAVGRLLAEAGFAVATGGYMGTMEAVSRGAREAGGTAVGVTSDQIESFRPIGPNPYITEEVRYATLRERLLHLVEQNDGIIVLPGGIGTLSEMSLAWSFLQTGEMPPRPLVLLGELWQHTMDSFIGGGHVRDSHRALLTFAATPETAVAAIRALAVVDYA